MDNESQTLRGKRSLVTGGTTGIGRAIARLLAGDGARVVIFGLKRRDLDHALGLIRDAGGEAYGLTADQSRERDIARIFREVDRRLGGLDVLVNNAAQYVGTVAQGSFKIWHHILGVNILGYMACTHEAIARMERNSHGEVKHGRPIVGHVVNIGSMSADVREEGGDVYVATKTAIQGFSESLRKSLNPRGIKVTLVEPGLVGTPLSSVPPKRQRKLEVGSPGTELEFAL